jgi:glyoxylase-like metal-dependent hydrolase (beta-lactamase superfamily II)
MRALLDMEKIASNVYASTSYPGVNVGFIAVPTGVIAIDAPTLPRDACAWRQQILETAGGPILYVILTDGHPDRLLSAGLLEAPVVATQAAYERASAYTDGFWRGVVEGWTRRYPEVAEELIGTRGVLPEILFTSDLTLHKGGMDVTVTRVDGAAPGSAWVRLPEQDVLFAGDTIVVGRPPIMAAALDSRAWLATLSSLRRSRFAGTRIVPGRGELCDPVATRSLSDYISLARRRVRSLHASGQARADMAALVVEMLSTFPVSDDESELAQRYVKAGLDRLYEELRPE